MVEYTIQLCYLGIRYYLGTYQQLIHVFNMLKCRGKGDNNVGKLGTVDVILSEHIKLRLMINVHSLKASKIYITGCR